MVIVCVVFCRSLVSLVSEVACRAQKPKDTSELSTNYGPPKHQYGHMYKHPKGCCRRISWENKRKKDGRYRESVRQGCRPNVMLDRYSSVY